MAGRVRWHARWVVPVATPPIAQGTVVTEGDRIVWVGPRADAPAGGRDEDCGDAILTPGLVNAHTHLDLTVLRGVLADLPFFPWVRTLTRALGELRPEEFLDSARLGVAEGLAAGTTTFADTATNDAAFTAMRELGVRGIAYREVFGPDPAAADAGIASLRAAVQAMRGAETALVRVGVSPHAPYSVSDALYARVAEYAAAEALPVAVHIAEGEDEDALVIEGSGPWAQFLNGRGIATPPRAGSALAVIERAGLLRRGTLLIHAVRVAADRAAAIADACCGVAHCPASNARLGHGIAPLATWLAAGVRVGLGSDSMASNDRMDLLEEARLATLLQRTATRSASAPDAATAFRLATLGGAQALDLEASIGSLEPGKQADLAVFVPAHPGALPSDPYEALVFGPRPATRHVVVAGEWRVRDAQVVGLDPALAARVAAVTERLHRWRTAQPAS